VAVGLGSDCMLKPYLRLAIRCYAALGTGRLQGSLAVLLTCGTRVTKLGHPRRLGLSAHLKA